MAETPRPIHWPRFAAVFTVSLALAIGCHMQLGSDWYEVAGFVTGTVGVYLAAVEHIWNWPVGIANVILYSYVFWQSRLYADMTLQLLYVGLLAHGWASWLRGTGHNTLPVTRLAARLWPVVAVAIAAGTAIYVPIIQHFKGAQPFLDSILTVASIVGQVMLNRKVIENWLVWIVADAVYIPLYISRQLYVTAILYGVFLVLAVIGWREWAATLNPSSSKFASE